MAMSRRLFALGAAGFAVAATTARAAPGDEVVGTWQGTLALVSGAGLQAPGYTSPELRIVIGGAGDVQVFMAREDARQGFEEVKAASFRMGRLGPNLVIVSIDAFSPLGQGWVETWSITATLRGADALAVVFTRQVNNMPEEPSTEAIFSIVHSGEMQRVLPDHV
jgi:hypothetical protein